MMFRLLCPDCNLRITVVSAKSKVVIFSEFCPLRSENDKNWPKIIYFSYFLGQNQLISSWVIMNLHINMDIHTHSTISTSLICTEQKVEL